MSSEDNRFATHPVIVGLGFIASLIAIFAFLTGYENIKQFRTNPSSTPSQTFEVSPTPSETFLPPTVTPTATRNSSTATPVPMDPATIVSWEFNSFGDIGGWGANDWDVGGLRSLNVTNGNLTYEVIGTSSMLYIRNLKLDAESILTAQIHMRVSKGQSADFYFGTDTDPDTGYNGKEFPFRVQPGEEFVLYQINTHLNAKWKGYITELRIDNLGPAKVEIDFIRLVGANP